MYESLIYNYFDGVKTGKPREETIAAICHAQRVYVKFSSLLHRLFNSEEIRSLLSNVFNWNKDKLN